MNSLRKSTLAMAICALAPFAALSAHDGDMMKSMDANGDGAISAEEHAAGAKAMFDRMDADKDGIVTAAEMEKASPQGDKKMSAADKIKVIDTNADGTLSAEEHAAGSRAMFDKMDTDHNGALSADEWKAGHAELMTKKGS